MRKAPRLSAPSRSLTAGSFTITNSQFCALLPVGALSASSITRSTSPSSTGSGLSRRIARWVRIASSSGIEKSGAAVGGAGLVSSMLASSARIKARPARGGNPPAGSSITRPMSLDLRAKVAVVGVGCTPFGELYEQSPEDLLCDAVDEALADAGCERERIEAAWVGTVMSTFGGDALADALKLFGRPMTRVQNYCASGMDAFRNACLAVAAGQYDVVLAVGFEKMRDGGFARPNRSHPVLDFGERAPHVFALSANRYFATYGASKKTLAAVAVKNHKNGMKSPKAHLKMEVNEETVLRAPMIYSPLGLFDCCPTTDGAAAAVVCRADLVKSFTGTPVWPLGLGLAAVSGQPYYKPSFGYVGFEATVRAAEQAYAQAKVTPAEIDFAEVHDCFTITEILNYEDLGFCARGQGGRFVEEGRADLGGEKPVNPSGGLKSYGHPVGATGVRMIYELTTQLRGQAGARQVQGAKIGLAHNLGGPGAISCVSILTNQA